jgi:predicted transcriptional regulator
MSGVHPRHFDKAAAIERVRAAAAPDKTINMIAKDAGTTQWTTREIIADHGLPYLSARSVHQAYADLWRETRGGGGNG